MQVIKIKLSSDIPPDICTEITKRACYVDNAISSCDYDSKESELNISVDDSADTDALTTMIKELINKMKVNRIRVKPRVVHSRTSSDEQLNENVVEELTQSGDIASEGLGVVSRGGMFQDLLIRLDRLFERMGTEIFGASIRHYNTLMPSDWLRRSGYFSSFAHSITFAMHLGEDYHKLEKFASRHTKDEELKFESIDELANAEYCLSPAVCYHTYGALMDAEFTAEDNGLKVFTAIGKCFRYESKNITALDRLWEFSMREIIFVGEKEKVLASRDQALELTWRLVELLDLSGYVETASDPFFVTNYKSLRFFQLANDLKFELQLPLNKDKSIAAASFNYHENFFGERFGIKTADGSEVHTGCAAYGLERLVYALLVQLGYEKTIERLDAAQREIM